MIDDYFWPNVNIKNPNDCWEWKGTLSNGYGIAFPFTNDVELAHRLSWRLTNGDIPRFIKGRKIVIRHLCNNRSCVNPRHLAIGNYGDNANDAKKIGRGIKLTKDQFITILYLHSIGVSQVDIRKRLRLSRAIVWKAVNGKGYSSYRMAS